MQVHRASHVRFTVHVDWPTLFVIELGKKQVEFAVLLTTVSKAASALVIEAFQARKTQVSRCILMIKRMDKKVWRIL